MNPNQNKCTLDQLLEHAESQALEDRQTRFRAERLKACEGSKTPPSSWLTRPTAAKGTISTLGAT